MPQPFSARATLQGLEHAGQLRGIRSEGRARLFVRGDRNIAAVGF
jgi:hypothetical protein